MDYEQSAPPLFKAAQYLRMSTESQHYSLGAQAEAIAEYARVRGLAVIKSVGDRMVRGYGLDVLIGLSRLERPARRCATGTSAVGAPPTRPARRSSG